MGAVTDPVGVGIMNKGFLEDRGNNVTEGVMNNAISIGGC